MRMRCFSRSSVSQPAARRSGGPVGGEAELGLERVLVLVLARVDARARRLLVRRQVAVAPLARALYRRTVPTSPPSDAPASLTIFQSLINVIKKC